MIFLCLTDWKYLLEIFGDKTNALKIKRFYEKILKKLINLNNFQNIFWIEKIENEKVILD